MKTRVHDAKLTKNKLMDAILTLYQNKDSYINAMKNSPQQDAIHTVINLIERAVSKSK